MTLALLAGCAAPPSPPTQVVSPEATPPPLPTATPDPYQTGIALRAAGDLEGAMAAFSQALTLNPDFVPARLARGALYLSRGEPSAALADAQAAIAADPKDGPAYALLGEVLRVGFGDLSGALEAYRQAARLDPTLAEAIFPVRWRTAVEAKQAEEMFSLAEEYAAAHPDNPLAVYYRGRALTAQGEPRTAISELLGALENGGPGAVWFALGEAYAADSAWPQARICYEQAQRQATAGDSSFSQVPDLSAADLAFGLGVAYLHTGECAQARAMLERALATEPERDEVHALIGQALICEHPRPTPTPYPSTPRP